MRFALQLAGRTSRVSALAAGLLLWLVAADSARAVSLLFGAAGNTYQLDGLGNVRITVGSLTNRSATVSAALQLQLWAIATPFDPAKPATSGFRLGVVNLAPLAAGAAFNNLAQTVVYSAPPAGVWSIVLFAEEDTGGAFAIRDFFNFPGQLSVAGSLVSYDPIMQGGIPIPAGIHNLMLDGSRLYWTPSLPFTSDRIDSVGTAPGSAPGVLINFGGSPLPGITFVQDVASLYVLRSVTVSGADIVRVSKTAGSMTRIAAYDVQHATGPRYSFGGIGIAPFSGTLYFAAFQNVSTAPAFIGSYFSNLPTAGGTISSFIPSPLNQQAEPANLSPTAFAADFLDVSWIDNWDQAIHHSPLGSPGSNSFDLTVAAGARFLTAAADGSLLWMEPGAPNRLRRRKPGTNGVVVTVFAGIDTDNYAVDGDRVYLVPSATSQLSWVSINGGAATPILSMLDTGIPGEIVTDGNAIYWASTDVFNFKTTIKKLGLPATGVPLAVQQPQSQHVAPGANVQLTASASGGGVSYIWYKNGVSLVPATGGTSSGDEPARAASVVSTSANTSTLALANVTAADMGFYTCVITNSAGTTTTQVAIVTVDTGGPSRLINLSTRGQVQAAAPLTPGFVMRGTGSKQLLIRAIGPTLGIFGLAALSDSKMEVVNQATGATIVMNDDWGGGASLTSTFASLGAFPLAANSKDAASFASIPVNSGGYTVRVTPSGTATSGLALAEVYDADALTSSARLVNVSTLGFNGTGADALTPGFVIGGTAPKRLLIRAIGPGLSAFGVGGLLADPRLSVIPAGMTLTAASNDDWGGTADLKSAFVAAGAFSVPDASKDAAVVVRLPPGGYSVVVAGATASATGNVLVEVYDLDP